MIIRDLGRVGYAETAQQMQRFTEERQDETPDELWLCEHDAVFTQGIAGRAEHLLLPGDIPVLATNRGGQVTYHGPGQLVAYPLLDLQRLRLHVKTYVYRLEEALLRTLHDYGVTGHRLTGAPGVYVRLADPFSHAAWDARPPAARPTVEAQRAIGINPFEGLGKIAALGIKVSRHRSYHGLALNVAMDLSPFGCINPCGYAGLETVDLAAIGIHTTWQDAAERLSRELQRQFGP
jgi:lipoyl(octanoyl) transferase